MHSAYVSSRMSVSRLVSSANACIPSGECRSSLARIASVSLIPCSSRGICRIGASHLRLPNWSGDT